MNTTSAPRSNVPLIIAIIAGAALGYGIGLVQNSFSVAALRDEITTARDEARQSAQAVESVEARGRRLEVYQRLDMAREAVRTGDTRTAIRQIRESARQIQRGTLPEDKALAQDLDALAEVPSLLALTAALRKLDKNAPLPENASAGSSQ